MDLIRESWRELWQNNRNGGFLTLAFWYTMLTSLYQYLVASRLGPSLPKSLTNFVTHPGVVTTFPHLSSNLWLKLILVYLTFLLIIVPYAVGGLYGGIASALKTRPQGGTFFLAFFRFGYQNFWKALGQIVLGLCLVAVVLLVLTALYLGVAAVGGGAMGVVFIVILAAVMLWMVGTLLYWFGFTFDTGESPARGLVPALRWSFTHLGQLYARMVLLLGLLIATLLVATFISSTVPFLGALVMVLLVGMVVPAFMAVYALLLYRQNSWN